MSEEVKKVKEGDETAVDDAVKKQIEERVVRHVVSFDEGKDKDKSKTVNPPATTDNIEALRKQLEDAERAREQVATELSALKEQAGVTKDELKQKTSQLQALALKEFEEKKALLVEKVRTAQGDDKAEEVDGMITSGADLDRVTRWLEIFEDSFKAPEPVVSEKPEIGKRGSTGKAQAIPPLTMDGESWDSVEKMVNHVYDNLETQLFLQKMNMPYDAQKLERYQAMEARLLKSLIDGEKNRQSITGRWSILQCRSCNKIITDGATICPNCGQSVYHKTAGGI